MRKIQVAICMFILIIIACFCEHDRLENLESHKSRLLQKQFDLEKMKAEISKLDFSKLRSMKCEEDIESAIKKFATHVSKFDLKTSSAESEHFFITTAEIKFSSKKEKYIYGFVNDLATIGIVDVEDLKIYKDSLLRVEMKCKFYSLRESEHSNAIFLNGVLNGGTENTEHIKLFTHFKLPKQYTLHCTLENRAFINDSWMEVGGGNDDFLLKEVSLRYVVIDNDGNEMKIKVGESW